MHNTKRRSNFNETQIKWVAFKIQSNYMFFFVSTQLACAKVKRRNFMQNLKGQKRSALNEKRKISRELKVRKIKWA